MMLGRWFSPLSQMGCPRNWLNLCIITTGARDPATSALHIILGKGVHIDIAEVVRWKVTNATNDEPCVRYVASFAGYGFYGDVITESEKYRWMGPERYDYAGTKVFLQHRHLIQLAKKGGNHLDFNFVEHHKTPAFTFTSFRKEGVWNVDGELFHAHKLSAQVFQGLISLFGTGPDV